MFLIHDLNIIDGFFIYEKEKINMGALVNPYFHSLSPCLNGEGALEKSDFKYLPNEIILIIFRFLSPKPENYSLLLVCKIFHKIANQAFNLESQIALDKAFKSRKVQEVSNLLKDPIVTAPYQGNILCNLLCWGLIEKNNLIISSFLQNPKSDFSAGNNMAIRLASENGQTDLVKILLKRPEVNPSALNNSAIRKASEKGNLETVKVLMLDPRVDPSALVNYAYVSALLNKHTEVAKELLKDKRVKKLLEKSKVKFWEKPLIAFKCFTLGISKK